MDIPRVYTPSPTPPLPRRLHPPRIPLPPVSISPSTVGLIPAPLFSSGKPLLLRLAVRDLPGLPNDSAPNSPIKRPQASQRSSMCSTASTSSSSSTSSPQNSAPSSPWTRPHSLQYERPAPLFSALDAEARPRSEAVWSERQSRPQVVCAPPVRKLRRRPSPKKESLRSLRMKDSEACLQRAYEERVEAYLSGEMFGRERGRGKWRLGEERNF